MTKQTNQTDTKKEQDRTVRMKAMFIEQFFPKVGNISELCKSLGICRATYYDWIKRDKGFRRNIEAEKEGLIDFAESKLFNLINDKNPTAIIFFLKTKAKHRGYIERIEQEHSGEFKPLKVIVSNDGNKPN